MPNPRSQDEETLQKIVEQRGDIEELKNTRAWRDLIAPNIEKRISYLKDVVVTDQYINDHNGYIKAISDINCLSDILNLVNSYDKAGERAIKLLDEYRELDKEKS